MVPITGDPYLERNHDNSNMVDTEMCYNIYIYRSQEGSVGSEMIDVRDSMFMY